MHFHSFELAKKLAMDDEYKLAIDNDYRLAMELQENENEDAERRRFSSRQQESVSSDSQVTSTGHKNHDTGRDKTGSHERQKDWVTSFFHWFVSREGPYLMGE